MTEWLGLDVTPPDCLPLLKQGLLQQAAQDCIQSGFGYFKGGDSTSSLDNLFQCSTTLTVKKLFSYARSYMEQQCRLKS